MSVEPLEDRRLLAATVYADALQSGWQDWSWDTTRNLSSNNTVYAGSRSISVQHDAAWAALYLRAQSNIALQPNEEIRFQIHGGSGGQNVSFKVVLPDNTFVDTANFDLTSSWNEVVIDYPASTAPSQIAGLVWQDGSGDSQSTFFVDQIEIGDFTDDDGGTTGGGAEDGPTITVDTTTVVRQISEEVYGLNFADDDLAADIDLPINRWGGNSTSRYDFKLDATNLASDFFFENSPSENSNVGNLPAGSAADRFVQDNQAVGANTIMTVGMLGWTPNGRNRQGSFPVNVYGPQEATNMYRPNHGNGIDTNGNEIVNDPTISSNQIDETFATEWITHLVSQHGNAANGGVNYYALDNEPMLWNSTHRDVHPVGAGYDEVLDKGVTYATAIKNADPTAQILGPTVWGWSAYYYSALDAEPGGSWWNNPLDRNAHGGQPFLPWYLQEMAAAEADTGTRLLDYLDIHFYPQESGIALTTAGNAATQANRLESTRALWDPTYVDDSWINTEVNLIPRMRDWIDTYYPGTKLALTEYNWGGVEHINGAVTQADILGILGREGVDIATMWDPPSSGEPTAYAFRMYRNYDGAGTDNSQFGEASLAATTTDVDDVAVFASQRSSDGATTIVLVNKSTDTLSTPVNLTGDSRDFQAERYTYDANDLGQIVRGADHAFTAGATTIDLPPSSITLLEIPSATTPLLPCDLTGAVGCDIADLDQLFTTGDPALQIPQWLVDASSPNNPLKLSSSHTYVYGDVNLDGQVDSTDLGLLLNAFGETNTGWGDGNLNADATVDSTDLGLVLNNFGHSSVTAATVAYVAEDIDRNGFVTPLDALRVINFANNDKAGSTVLTKWNHLDVDRDGRVAELDALRIINRLNRIRPSTADRIFAELETEESEDESELDRLNDYSVAWRPDSLRNVLLHINRLAAFSR